MEKLYKIVKYKAIKIKKIAHRLTHEIKEIKRR